MTPEQLKASILQYAVQGKLVEQHPDDGSADSEIEKAEQLKAELNSKGILKGRKTKELIPIKEEVPFDIPETWRWVRLGSIVEIFGRIGFRGYTKNDIVNKGEGAITMSPSNINQDTGEIDFSDCTYLSWEKYEESPEIMLVPGDIVLVKTGSSYGKCGIIRELLEKATINPQLVILKYVSCDNNYLNWVLKSPSSRNQYEQFVTGTSIPTFSQEKLANMFIPLPPIEEQHRIVAKIEELLPYVDRYAKAYEKLEQFNAKFPEDVKKSILQYAIQGKLVEQRPEEGTGEELYQKIQENQPTLKDSKSDLVFDAMDFDIPETWKWVEVNQIFNFVDYRGKTPNKIAEGVFLVTASNIRQGYMDYTRKEHISRDEYETRKNRGITEKGDLLFTTEAPMGNAAICDLEECSCGQRVITFKEYTDGTVYAKLFMYFILSPAFQKQLVDNCTGTTAKGIKADKLKHLLLPLPPISEQYRIVEKIDELLPFCNRLSEGR